jgi:crotonobetainyl-CoA:carnitine CoA-transferase CaiB-like acyl-CoA transferase
MGVLDGVRVLTLEQAVSAPFASRHLADQGAEIIKLERRGSGDFARGYDTSVLGQSSHFVWLNRGKRSLTLDVKHPRAKEVLDRLLERSDVFLQNLIPGAAGRLGLGAEQLRARFPRLIVCNISGYGANGPYRDRKAYDLLVQCESGLVSVTGGPDAPAKPGIATADIAAGMYAYSGILSALYRRERSGEGAVVEVSMLEALAEWMGYPMYYTEYRGEPPARTGMRHATIAPYGPFRTADGGTVVLGVQNEREWQALCEHLLGQPQLARDPRFADNSQRVANREELESRIAKVIGGMDASAATARLDAIGIANGRMRSMAEFIEHPQLAARARWREVDSPAGPLRALLPPVDLSGEQASMGPIPGLGEHNDEILDELGFDSDSIAGLREAGVI